jgi:hypothetical protein
MVGDEFYKYEQFLTRSKSYFLISFLNKFLNFLIDQFEGWAIKLHENG